MVEVHVDNRGEIFDALIWNLQLAGPSKPASKYVCMYRMCAVELH